MTSRITGTRPKTVGPTDGVNPSKKLDGKKTQLIDQFRLTNKAAGEKTTKIKEDWHDSITMAHKMLVNVNTELDRILVELDEISDALKKIGKGTGSDGAVKKFNAVKTEMKSVSNTAKKFAVSFRNDIPPILAKAGSAIEKFTQKDYENLEKKIGNEKVGKIKNTLAKIKTLEQNVKNTFQVVDQPADHSVKKKSQKARHEKDVLGKSSDDSSSRVLSTIAESFSEVSDSKKSSDNERKKADSSAESSYLDDKN
jgi:hypothetical protein